MRIALIKPNINNDGYAPSDNMQPLTMAVLAGLTPAEHDVVFYDDRIEKIPYDEKTDLVGITVESFTAKRAYEISHEFRKRGVSVVMGGFHPTLIPEEAALHADSVVIGEAEDIWGKVLKDAERKNLQKFYKQEKRPDLSGIKPRRDIFKGKKYLPLTLVEASRGCVSTCDFCSISSFYGHSHNYRPVEDVIMEIKGIQNKNIFFTDDNLTGNKEICAELFKKMAPLKKRWMGQGSIKIGGDTELLKLMRKSGCMGLLIGFESLDGGNLRQMGKGWVELKKYEQHIKNIRACGLKIYGTFLIGYDGDNEKTLKENLKFAIDQKFFLAAFNHLTPFPSTPLYEKLSKKKRLLHEKWWIDEGYRYGDMSFEPELMPAEKLSRSCLKTRRKFYGLPSIFKRMFDLKANCANADFMTFFTLNLLLRKEIAQKTGLVLGKEKIGEKNNEPFCN